MEEEIVYEFKKKIISNRHKENEPILKMADHYDLKPLKYVQVGNAKNTQIDSNRHKIVGPYILDLQGKLKPLMVHNEQSHEENIDFQKSMFLSGKHKTFDNYEYTNFIHDNVQNKEVKKEKLANFVNRNNYYQKEGREKRAKYHKRGLDYNHTITDYSGSDTVSSDTHNPNFVTNYWTEKMPDIGIAPKLKLGKKANVIIKKRVRPPQEVLISSNKINPFIQNSFKLTKTAFDDADKSYAEKKFSKKDRAKYETTDKKGSPNNTWVKMNKKKPIKSKPKGEKDKFNYQPKSEKVSSLYKTIMNSKVSKADETGISFFSAFKKKDNLNLSGDNTTLGRTRNTFYNLCSKTPNEKTRYKAKFSKTNAESFDSGSQVLWTGTCKYPLTKFDASAKLRELSQNKMVEEGYNIKIKRKNELDNLKKQQPYEYGKMYADFYYSVENNKNIESYPTEHMEVSNSGANDAVTKYTRDDLNTIAGEKQEKYYQVFDKNNNFKLKSIQDSEFYRVNSARKTTKRKSHSVANPKETFYGEQGYDIGEMPFIKIRSGRKVENKAFTIPSMAHIHSKRMISLEGNLSKSASIIEDEEESFGNTPREKKSGDEGEEKKSGENEEENHEKVDGTKVKEHAEDALATFSLFKKQFAKANSTVMDLYKESKYVAECKRGSIAFDAHVTSIRETKIKDLFNNATIIKTDVNDKNLKNIHLDYSTVEPIEIEQVKSVSSKKKGEQKKSVRSKNKDEKSNEIKDSPLRAKKTLFHLESESVKKRKSRFGKSPQIKLKQFAIREDLNMEQLKLNTIEILQFYSKHSINLKINDEHSTLSFFIYFY